MCVIVLEMASLTIDLHPFPYADNFLPASMTAELTVACVSGVKKKSPVVCF